MYKCGCINLASVRGGQRLNVVCLSASLLYIMIVLLLLRQGLSLNRTLLSSARLAAYPAPGIPCLHPQR